MRLLVTAYFILFLMIGSVSAQSDAADKKLQVKNKPLPKAMIQDMSGKKVDISKYGDDDKMTVFTFWATWCSPCKKELSNFADLYEDWQSDYNVEIVAVSIDDIRSKAKVKTYAAGQAWDFDVLLDQNSDLKRALNFQTIPYLIVEKDCKIIYAHSGYVEGDEYELEEVFEEHAE